METMAKLAMISTALLHVAFSHTTHQQCSTACLDPPDIRALRRADVGATNATRELCTSGDSPLSRCQWDYEINFRSTRVPQYIASAACETCSHCRQPNSTSECLRVYYKVPVFLRQNNDCGDDGYYRYRKYFRSVLVACTCVEPERTTNVIRHAVE